MAPAVSVVVPTRSRVDLLALTLRSILAQRDVELEVVVVDDASEDATPALLHDLADRVVSVRNDRAGGAARARNLGLERSSADWVAFCDDDDLWAPDKLALQLVAVAAEPGARWATTGAVMVDEDLAILAHERYEDTGPILDQLLVRNCVPAGGSSVMADRGLLRSLGGFDEQMGNSEDWDLWIRVAHASPIAVVDRPLVAYRIWPGSKSRNIDGMRVARRRIVSRYEELRGSRGVLLDEWAHERFLAKQELRAGRRLASARTFARLARRDPAQYVRALTALVAPQLTERVGTRRATRALPDTWLTEAAEWLAPLRRPVGVRA